MFGPVGPLKNARCSSPQRPSNPIHGNARPRGGRVARDRLDDGAELIVRAARVVTADAFVRRAAEVERRAVEVRVRAGGDVDDGMGAVDELRASRRPRSPARRPRAGCSRPRRLLRQRLAGGGRVEVELDHLPVALVGVVPVVEDVEEPVLERELVGMRALGRDVGVDRRLRALVIAAPTARSRSPGRADCRGSRGGSRAARHRGRAARADLRRGRRGSTGRARRPCQPEERVTSIGRYGSPGPHSCAC